MLLRWSRHVIDIWVLAQESAGSISALVGANNSPSLEAIFFLTQFGPESPSMHMRALRLFCLKLS